MLNACNLADDRASTASEKFGPISPERERVFCATERNGRLQRSRALARAVNGNRSLIPHPVAFYYLRAR